jgi:hypothetical protein
VQPLHGAQNDIIQTRAYPAQVRTLRCALPWGELPLHAGRRVLVTTRERDAQAGVAGASYHATEHYFLDFEPAHINALLDLSAAERAALSDALVGTLGPTLVGTPLAEVITRNYACNPEDLHEEDLEYARGEAPADWKAYMSHHFRPTGFAGLAFDERPPDRREPVQSVGSACVMLRLLLPPMEEWDDMLAVTESGVVALPVIGQEGWIAYYH